MTTRLYMAYSVPNRSGNSEVYERARVVEQITPSPTLPAKPPEG